MSSARLSQNKELGVGGPSRLGAAQTVTCDPHVSVRGSWTRTEGGAGRAWREAVSSCQHCLCAEEGVASVKAGWGPRGLFPAPQDFHPGSYQDCNCIAILGGGFVRSSNVSPSLGPTSCEGTPVPGLWSKHMWGTWSQPRSDLPLVQDTLLSLYWVWLDFLKSSFYPGGSWGSENLGNLPKLTEVRRKLSVGSFQLWFLPLSSAHFYARVGDPVTLWTSVSLLGESWKYVKWWFWASVSVYVCVIYKYRNNSALSIYTCIVTSVSGHLFLPRWASRHRCAWCEWGAGGTGTPTGAEYSRRDLWVCWWLSRALFTFPAQNKPGVWTWKTLSS